MCRYQYYEMMKKCKDLKYPLRKMVLCAREHGIKPTAHLFETTPKTVRKWLRRWKEQGGQWLVDQSRALKKPRRLIMAQQSKEAVDLKVQLPSWGAPRIKSHHGLKISDKALRRICREEGLMKRKRKKHQTKNDLRAVKAAWRFFEQFDLDTKDLQDIPQLWPQIRRLGLPTIQYTCREVISGLQFIAFARERSLSCATVSSVNKSLL